MNPRLTLVLSTLAGVTLVHCVGEATDPTEQEVSPQVIAHTPDNCPTPPPQCGADGQRCCTGSACNVGLVCAGSRCGVPPPDWRSCSNYPHIHDDRTVDMCAHELCIGPDTQCHAACGRGAPELRASCDEACYLALRVCLCQCYDAQRTCFSVWGHPEWFTPPDWTLEICRPAPNS
jgi:hypothetical protein